MSFEDSKGYVSIIGFNYLDPIILLLEELLSDKRGEPNEVKSGKKENGISCSIIVLAILLIESAIARVKYDIGKTTPKSELEFMQKEFPDYLGIDSF